MIDKITYWLNDQIIILLGWIIQHRPQASVMNIDIAVHHIKNTDMTNEEILEYIIKNKIVDNRGKPFSKRKLLKAFDKAVDKAVKSERPLESL